MNKNYTKLLMVPNQHLKQIWRIMRLTTLLLIATIMQVSATTFAQKITLAEKNAALSRVFIKISKQTGYDFWVNSSLLKGTKPVTIDVKDTELDLVLKAIFKDQPVTYRVEDKVVTVIRREEPSFFDRVTARFQTIDVRGKVVDQNNSPLPGATIKVKGSSSLSVTSDERGDFHLKGVEDGAMLEISFIGFAPITLIAKENLGIVKLNEMNAKLDEVIVQAYGTTSQRFSTSNIGTVNADVIAKQPVSNPLLALQGRVPGLFITQTSGLSASEVSVNIQGLNSITNGNEPFYVIDGVPFSSRFPFNSGLAGSALGGNSTTTFNFINPADIESISILKDADATAIYGSRAANGAILITTKKGKAGKTKIDGNMQNGWGKVVKKLDLMNTQQYLDMRKEAFSNNNEAIPTSSTPPLISNYDLTVWNQTSYTDWQKELVGGTAEYTDIQASISGGNLNTQFLASYGYNRQTTVYPNSLGDIKGNLNFNLNHSSADAKFKFMLSAGYMQNKNRLNGIDLMEAALIAPNSPMLYKADGTLNFEPYPNDPLSYSFDNPLRETLKEFKGNNSNLIANNTISYQLLNTVKLLVSSGYNVLRGDEVRIVPLSSYKPDALSQVRYSEFSNKSIQSWIIEPQVNFNKQTKFGTFDFLIGSTFQQTKNEFLVQTGSQYGNDVQLENLLAAPLVSIDFNARTLYRYNALFGRLNYQLKNKYIVNLSARRDGSSRFGDSNKINNFYGIGGAWLFSEEPLIKKLLKPISTGKLRISYGTTGNDQIGDYEYLSLLDIYQATNPYQQTTALYPTRISNSLLQWEETTKLNFGMDIGLFKDRFVFNVNYYKSRSSNQLLQSKLPYMTGFPSVRQNLPATVQNTGFEGQLNIEAIRSAKFNWQISANITIPKNKLVSFDDYENSYYANSFTVGKSISTRKAYKFAGVNPTTGLYEFYNNMGERTSTPNSITDRTEFIDLSPKFYGGISNTFQYKGFDLNFFFQFVNRKAANYRFGNFPGLANRNQINNFLTRWKKPGDVTDLQKVSNGTETQAAYGLATSSDAAYTGASYARLKNISLSYNLPQKWISGLHMTKARIYMQGQNLVTFSNYVGADPETLIISSLPPLEMYTFGIQFTF